jgi:signal transduction histidine kinase
MSSFEPASLKEIANYLFSRREAILNNWRLSCEQDDSLSKVSSLSREEFNNLLPVVLDILEQRLLNNPEEADLANIARGHGLHRWHKAHALMESMSELNHLSQVLYRELATFASLFPDSDRLTLLYVHSTVASVMQQTVAGSIDKYDELQRLQAASRVNTLQRALEKMNALLHDRGDMLRKSSHDLRGSVGIVYSAAMLLKEEDLTVQERDEYVDVLNRNLGNVQSMLTEMMDLSRLESGQETLRIGSVDASQILRDLVASAQGMAQQQQIVLQADGPDSLLVQTDHIKLRRIAQNILINALKYTRSSGEKKAVVSVSWSSEGSYRWVFSIQDSGPGMPDNVAGAFSGQLKPTVEPTAQMSPDQSEPVSILPVELPEIPPVSELTAAGQDPDKGEGVGLQIVKHLCDMLDANLDIESQKGRGTLFRVRLPVSYEGKNLGES